MNFIFRVVQTVLFAPHIQKKIVSNYLFFCFMGILTFSCIHIIIEKVKWWVKKPRFWKYVCLLSLQCPTEQIHIKIFIKFGMSSILAISWGFYFLIFSVSHNLEVLPIIQNSDFPRSSSNNFDQMLPSKYSN